MSKLSDLIIGNAIFEVNPSLVAMDSNNKYSAEYLSKCLVLNL